MSSHASLFPNPPTPFELVMEIAHAGGLLWIEEESEDRAIRHRGAPKAQVKLLREMDRALVIAAVEEHQRQVAGIRGWLLQNVVPGRGFQTNLEKLYSRYRRAGGNASLELFVSGLPYRVVEGFVMGVIPVEDFTAGLADGYEFRNGTQVRCFSCLHHQQLTVIGRDVLDDENLLEVEDEHGERFQVKEKDCFPLVPKLTGYWQRRAA